MTQPGLNYHLPFPIESVMTPKVSRVNRIDVGFRSSGAFESKSLAEAAKAMGATSAPVESKDLALRAPEIAENGNVVRIGALSNIAGTTQIAFVVEKNPSALAASFDIMAGTDANVETNVKMGQSSNVYALAKAGDKYYYAVKEVKVTLGGCGG
jgi:sulfur-oxidizing protein SoxY